MAGDIFFTNPGSTEFLAGKQDTSQFLVHPDQLPGIVSSSLTRGAMAKPVKP
jgi:hypothetical protein